VVCTSHTAPFSLPKYVFFSGVDNGVVCTSHAALFSLPKHVFSAVSITGQCAHHAPPHFLSRNTFFLYKNSSRLNTSIFYDCISIVLILSLFIIIL
jgi:hypothetical protein